MQSQCFIGSRLGPAVDRPLPGMPEPCSLKLHMRSSYSILVALLLSDDASLALTRTARYFLLVTIGRSCASLSSACVPLLCAEFPCSGRRRYSVFYMRTVTAASSPHTEHYTPAHSDPRSVPGSLCAGVSPLAPQPTKSARARRRVRKRDGRDQQPNMANQLSRRSRRSGDRRRHRAREGLGRQ
jgi:hypothetical protein